MAKGKREELFLAVVVLVGKLADEVQAVYLACDEQGDASRRYIGYLMKHLYSA